MKSAKEKDRVDLVTPAKPNDVAANSPVVAMDFSSLTRRSPSLRPDPLTI